MTTRCPQCGTTFKVVPDQLRVRNGLVRCGECATVFDGRACLVAQIPGGFEISSTTSVPSTAAAAPVTRAEPVIAATGAVLANGKAPVAGSQPTVATTNVAAPGETPITSSLPEPEPPAVLRGRSAIARQDPYVNEGVLEEDDDEDSERALQASIEPVEHHAANSRVDQDDVVFRIGERSADPDAHDDVDPRDEQDDHRTPAVRGESRTRYHGTTDVGRTPPEFLDSDHQARRSFLRSLWGYACVLGLLLLAVQLIFAYRSSIADMAPQLRPLLVRLCEPLGCEVGYARHIDRIAITSSSLQPPAGHAGAPQQDAVTKLVLRASLRNRYDQPQPWPALRLDLSDLSDTVVIRKVLLPEDYLPEGQTQRPFEAGAELNIAVPIQVNGPHVNGFQLHKFFP
ncbi:DUF3426 domain-containing protein [Bordetella muralis]|uniref:DUF3426 domain-containing protein n=1 Tax=Bordetella muralis TaxID=1649130 RepID=UPI0039F05F36